MQTRKIRVHRQREPRALQTHVAYDRDNAAREDVAALLERLAHHLRAGIIVGDRDAIPLPDQLAVKVVVGPMGDDAMLRVKIGLPRNSDYPHPRVERELAHPGG